MTKPKTGKRVTTISVDDWLWVRTKIHAARCGVSASSVTEEALRAWLGLDKKEAKTNG